MKQGFWHLTEGMFLISDPSSLERAFRYWGVEPDFSQVKHKPITYPALVGFVAIVRGEQSVIECESAPITKLKTALKEMGL
ncbi:hypothetical protein ACQU0X_28930 [Pseudovibrio ascidiaceicola]|uniref:hypothetical protein n=1 Tax=Pseudovibrio ascidiaceicola TaxID=285279 RepID=UPI003D35D059